MLHRHFFASFPWAYLIADIKSLSGEPDYKSVNLTWEIEPQPLADEEYDHEQQPLPIPAFQVYFCEMQSWGPQRCKSKVLSGQQQQQVENSIAEGEEEERTRNGREFSLIIDNLKMATKYSFHVRQLLEDSIVVEPKGRKIDEKLSKNDLDKGEMIIIPTKGCE